MRSRWRKRSRWILKNPSTRWASELVDVYDEAETIVQADVLIRVLGAVDPDHAGADAC
jgi:hypothetical protein